MTIFALASGRGKAGVAIIRLSGKQAATAIRRLTTGHGAAAGNLPPPRKAVFREFRDPETNVMLDYGLVLWFPAPHSFTGEDVAEFHIHGGGATIAGLARALSALPGLRPAEPGEFSRRAFENGKMDLTEAEGLADLVEAETESQRRQALRQLGGDLGRLYEGWRGGLVAAMADIEAGIDFADEDLPQNLAARACAAVAKIAAEIERHLDDRHRGERLRDGLYAVILGPPNVGKSTLLNVLARRDVVIVSDIPGTTRDVIEIHLDLGGYPVTVADTAGLRDGGDAVESEGVRRAMDRAALADIRIVLCDARDWPEIGKENQQLITKNTIVAVNKTDLLETPLNTARDRIPEVHALCPISALTGHGMDQFVAVLEQAAAGLVDVAGAPVLTRERHRRALVSCVGHLQRALGGKGDVGGDELMAEDLRLAARALGRITGRVDVEDILDVVFREFCIGK